MNHVCEKCGNKMFGSHGTCVHCGKFNYNSSLFGNTKAYILCILCLFLFGFTGSLFLLKSNHIGFILSFILSLSLIWIILSPIIVKCLNAMYSKFHLPQKCEHKFKENDCWCIKCGILRPQGHKWNESQCECYNCAYKNHDFKDWREAVDKSTVEIAEHKYLCSKCGESITFGLEEDNK